MFINTNQIPKKFNEWVSKNFKGLSAYTLCQFLLMDFKDSFSLSFYKSDVDNMVNVLLFEYMCGNHDDDHTKNFMGIQMLVNECSWL